MYRDNIFLSERMLNFINPVFARLARIFPKTLAAPLDKPQHPSAMLVEKNFIYRKLFPRFLKNVTVDEASLNNVKAICSDCTTIYVTTGLGHLEYNYFADLFESVSLPLAEFCNSLTSWRWMRWSDFWAQVRSLEAEITEKGFISDPVNDGALIEMMVTGRSALLVIPAQILTDETLKQSGPARLLADVIEAQKDSAKKIEVVPLDFVWSRKASAGKRPMTDLLFGEKDSPGFIRRFTLFFKHFRTHARALVGTPIDVSSIVAESENSEAGVEKLKLAISKELGAERLATVGPKIKPRAVVIEEVLSDDKLDEEICKMAAERNKPADEVRELAVRYIKEIAADLDYTHIEIVDRIISPVLYRLYENFDVDNEGLSRARKLCAEGPVVFVPNHKSHVDYLILSHLFYRNGLTTPHIAAGVNLSIWPLGNIFRRCGAYFIRREFKDNHLYRQVLETYLKVLVKDGFCQEFFIEGGRSRTGRMKAPKMGMIAMLSKACGDAGISGINFVPVSLTYDRVIEQKNYVEENEGQEKSAEKTSHLLKLTKFLKRRQSRHGSIYVRFGEPTFLPANSQGTEKILAAANNIAGDISKMGLVTPLAIASAALLASARRAVLIEDYFASCRIILMVLNALGVELSKSLTDEPLEIAMQKALAQIVRARLVVMRNDALWPYILIPEEKRMSLAFNKNSIVENLAPAALLLYVAGSAAMQNKVYYASEAEEQYHSLAMITSKTFFPFAEKNIFEKFSASFEILSSLNLISAHSGSVSASSIEKSGVKTIASAITPLLESLFIATSYLANMKVDTIGKKELVSAIQKTGTDLINLQKIQYREANGRFDIEDALNLLEKMRILEKVADSGEKPTLKTLKKSADFNKIQNLQVELESILKSTLN